MNYWKQVKESRADGCMETLNYYADLTESGHKLSEQQRKDYREKCSILMCMGDVANEYAVFMLNLLNE